MYRRPAPLSETHSTENFDCGEPELNAWLKDMALYNQGQNYTRTFVIADRDFNVVGYQSLCAGMIHRSDVTRTAKGSRAPNDLPVAVLARLAVDKNHQCHGLGADLMRNAMVSTISAGQLVAFRGIVVDALNGSAQRFYAQYGFLETKISPTKLILPAKVILRHIELAAKDA